jgi:hypothetical protein
MTNHANSAKRVCPFLGLQDDPDSSVAFPSNLNYCHRSQPPGSARFNHQEEFCLTTAHSACPAFLRKAKIPLPQHIRAHHSRAKKNSAKKILSGLILLTVCVALGWGFMKRKPSAAPQTSAPTLRQVTPSASNTPVFSYLLDEEASATPTRPPTITGTPTLHVPLFGSVTPTQPPTLTPSITPIPFVSAHQLDVPLGTERKFIIRRLAYNERLDRYVQQYSTSFKAVQAINYYLYLTDVMKRDGLVIFPIGFTDVSGMNVLSVYQIQENERGVNYEYIAQKFKIDLDAFKYYNGITSAGDRPIVGAYYLIPLRRLIP